MRATTETLEGNLIRLSVEIDEPEFEKALGDVVKTLANQIRVPGFRPGKVPRKVLEARMGGAAALRAEAIRESLPDFYAQAVIESEIDPIASPDIDITAGESGGAVSFNATVQVRPSVSIPGYVGLQVTLPGLTVTDEDIDKQVDRLRENDAELELVGRAAIDGDLVTVDLHGNDDTEAEVVGIDDYLYEVGSGTVLPELDEHLRGAKAGDILAFEAPTPGDAEQIVSFRVLIKEVKVKKLPETTDEWAAESSEFSTVAELRADITDRMSRVKLIQSQMALREKTIEAVAELVVDEDVPEVLVDEEVNSRLHDLQHRLEQQKLGLGEYLQATGRTPDDLLAGVRVEANKAVKADLALRALAEAEELQVDDDELDAEVATMAERLDTTPAVLRHQLDTNGRTGAVRSELRKAKALQWLLDNVALFDEEGNPMSRDDLKNDASKEIEESE
ncbi:MAG TPA: trigger factor [Acidimicrobiales bacterium]|jgi:trigger factor|nr:trigger factor [Acidimicrobiales bacterium]